MPATTLAVLPFVNGSSNPEHEYLSDGITEEIIHALARIDGLKVTSRTSSFYFKNKHIALPEVARQLNVAVLLEGSVRIAGTTIRINARLLQAENDFQFWSETWDRKLENIFDIEDEISLLIADRLREHTGHFELSERLVPVQTPSLDAYSYALQARFHFNKWNPEDVATAIKLYEKALALDANHTESHVGLADAYGFMATTEFLPRLEAWQKAASHTQRALELDPANAGVQYQLANLAFFTECDFASAWQHTEKALEAMPNYPEARQLLAFLHIISGDLAGGLEQVQVALAIDPLSLETIFYHAFYCYRTGDYAKGLEVVEHCLSQNAHNIPAIFTKCYCLLMLGRMHHLLEFLDALPQQVIVAADELGMRCLAWLLLENEEKAQPYLSQLQEEAANPAAMQQHLYLYLALAISNRADEAFALLKRGLENNSALLMLAINDPLGRALFKDERHAFYTSQFFKRETPTPETLERAAPISAADAAVAATQLSELMQAEEAFLNPKLSLRDLAAMVHLHPNQLSWLLNEHIGQSFNEYVNTYRTERFKELAVNPDNAHISLLGLAYESGFNSKTVFNTWFKKLTGSTPKAFLAANASGSA